MAAPDPGKNQRDFWQGHLLLHQHLVPALLYPAPLLGGRAESWGREGLEGAAEKFWMIFLSIKFDLKPFMISLLVT